MRSWFSKKLFIKDLLQDFVDIHNHILPGIDDGAKTTADALALISRMRQLGINQFILTPHVMNDFYPNTAESINKAYKLLIDSLDTETRSNIMIHPAAEYMLDIHFESLVKNNQVLALKGTYVLVELSYFQPPINLEILIKDLKHNGYTPVLAHPERYVYYHNNPDYYNKLKGMGCLFQLNLMSLGMRYGKNVQMMALHLLNNGFIDFTGTDIHNISDVETLESLTVNKTLYYKLSAIVNKTNSTFTLF